MNNREDIFDKLIKLPLLNRFAPIYEKYKEILLYVLFGGLSFLVSIGTYALFGALFEIHELISNVLSWIITVAFAFFTNRIWVFDALTDSISGFIRQLSKFYAGRIITLVIEEIILLIFIMVFGLPSMPVKIAAQIIVITFNYIVSKLLIFRKEPKDQI